MSFTRVATRRRFLRQVALASGASMAQYSRVHGQTAAIGHPICAFVKFLQGMSFKNLAQTLKRMGYNGIEATVRAGGQVAPERVEDDLPKLVDALRQEKLSMTIMASDINRADDALSEKTLRLASKLGIKRYRMAYYRYDPDKAVVSQIASFRSMAMELAALNRELGLQAIYQNHAGARYLGGTLWDLRELLEGIPVAQMAVGFDLRHAMVEGGMSWPVYWDMIKPHLGAVYVKDFVWEHGEVVNVPLGDGWVDKGFFTPERLLAFDGPISLHVEYLRRAGLDANIGALARDLVTLKEWL
ncbi:MAG: TIM barrel protein [Verrucomicrobiota bacterium]|nr:sugar phosphate isomerase/epimerase [Verrucomicrobiota bacterium]MDG1890610.1 TIM barrel protein [Verrucomicrobiota bacterium]